MSEDNLGECKCCEQLADKLQAAEAEVVRLKSGNDDYDIAALDFIRSNDMPVEFLGKPITHYAAYLIRTLREEIMTVVWKKLDSYAELHNLTDWEWLVSMRVITPDDGAGYWATEEIQSNISAWEPKPERATHVAWFAK